jgi:mono/diheme cytochrome c family protein
VRRAAAATAALLAALGAVLACGAPRDEDAAGEALAPAPAAASVAADVPVVAASAPEPAYAKPAEASLADQAREIIRSSCGTCHTTSSPQANPKALAIYDLERPDWGATMSRAQLDSFARRVAGKAEWAGEPRATLDAYVEDLRGRAER